MAQTDRNLPPMAEDTQGPLMLTKHTKRAEREKFFLAGVFMTAHRLCPQCRWWHSLSLGVGRCEHPKTLERKRLVAIWNTCQRWEEGE